MRLLRGTGGGSPDRGGRVAAADAIDEFVHRGKMDRPIDEPILHSVIPARVLGVAAARHRAVVSDVRKGIAAGDRIVEEHRIGAERSLTAEGERTVMVGRNAAIVFVVEGLSRARAVDRFRVVASGKAVVVYVGSRCVG